MTGLRYSPLHVTEFCGEMQGKFKVGLTRLRRIPLKFADSLNFKRVGKTTVFTGLSLVTR